jgi:hypothetical protein
VLPNPIDAMFRCETLDELAFVMEEAFKKLITKDGGEPYTDSDWAKWAVKYKDFYTARKCAVSTYCRLRDEKRIPHV